MLAAFFNVGYHNPDEYFQLTELASYKLGITPAAHLAWEFNAGIRPALQPAMIYGLCKLTNLSNPAMISFLLRLISALAGWGVTALFVLVCLKQVNSDETKKVILYLSVFLWFMPYIHSRFGSENWSGIFFFAGLSVFLLRYNEEDAEQRRGEDGERKTLLRNFSAASFSYLLCGILMGLSLVVRLQSSLMIAGFLSWLLIYGKQKYKHLLLLALGILCSVFVGLLADRWLYDRWIFTAVNYFRVNVLEGKAVLEWDIMPWWTYFSKLFINLIPPFSILFILAVFVFFFRYYKNVLTWVCLPFLLVHIIEGHKELRFLFPLVIALPVIVGLAFDAETNTGLITKLKNLFSQRAARILARVYILINIGLMLVACVKPANEAFSLYDFIYSNYNDKPVNVYTASENPYVLVGVPVDFFKPVKLNVITVSNISELNRIVSSGDTVNLFFQNGLHTDEGLYLADKQAKLVFQNIPAWVEVFNFNNWLKRAKIWRVYEIQKMKPSR